MLYWLNCSQVFLRLRKFYRLITTKIVMLGKLGARSVRALSQYSRGSISKRLILTSNRQNVRYGDANLRFNFKRNYCKTIDSGTPKTVNRKIQSSTDCELEEKPDIDEETQSEPSSELSNRTSFEKNFDVIFGSENTDKITNDESIDNSSSIKSDFNSNLSSNSLKLGTESVNSHNTSYPSMAQFQLPSNWRKSHLGAQGIKFPGEIYVIKSIQDELKYMDVLEDFLQEKVLGFDTEHCPVQHLVCVVQLATRDRAVLWQCFNYKRKMPHYLKEILVGSITKVGHACMDDAIMISKQFKEEPQNLIDTNCWARDLHCSPQSLQGLCAIFLGEHLSKTHQQSNWKKENLSPGQITYAATDAWISLKVYEEMNRHAEELGVALTPMYKNLQERYQEVTNSRRLKRRRRRQRVKEKKQEIKAKALEQMSDDSSQEQNTIPGETSNSDGISNSANEVTSSKDVTGEDVNSESVNMDSISDKKANEFLNTIDPSAVDDAVDEEKAVTEKKSTGSRQRHKKFLLKFHSLE